MNATASTAARLAVLQYGNDDGTFREVAYQPSGLEKVTLCAEGPKLDPVEHRKRAVEVACTLPAEAYFVVNAEHYGPKNVSVAGDILSAVAKAAPKLQRSAYLPEQSLSVLAGIGWDPWGRAASVAQVVQTTRALKAAGATFASIDGYMRLDSGEQGIRDYLSASPFDAWCNAVGQAASIVEAELPPIVWLSNRFHSNGRALPAGKVEPFVSPETFMKMVLFAEVRGWKSISLLGWSDVLKKSSGRGFTPLSDRDAADLRTLRNTAKP